MGGLSISKGKKKTTTNTGVKRKRLSMSAATGQSSLLLDGFHKDAKHQNGSSDDEQKPSSESALFKTYAVRTKTGVVPFNPNKVNQDRAICVPNVANSGQNGRTFSLFGVFDGHGMLGHDVSSFLLRQMPKFFENNKHWSKDPKHALDRCFYWLTKQLAKSDVNCTFSGTTAVCVLFDDSNLYTANVGDSRAVLARRAR